MRRASWNPLVCGGTSLPAPKLLSAKLISLALLLTGTLHSISTPERFLMPVQAGVIAVTAALLLNRLVRVAAGVLCFTLVWLAWAPVMRLWETNLPLLLLVCISSLVLFVCMSFPSIRSNAIWLNVLLHAALILWGGFFPPVFSLAMLAASLAFVPWPREMIVIYDGDCGICTASKRWWSKIDFDHAYAWFPNQSGIGSRWSIRLEALEQRAHFICDGQIEAGFRAVKRMFLYNPVTYVAMLLAVAAPPDGWLLYRRIVVVLCLGFFGPPFERAWEALYLWIARNRYRLSSNGACATGSKR
jgi:predicted DCC family thiol-disulfide oxidoreductase YuxK